MGEGAPVSDGGGPVGTGGSRRRSHDHLETSATDLLVGRLVAAADNHLVLARTPYDEPRITVMPMTAVLAVSTHQLTETEQAVFD